MRHSVHRTIKVHWVNYTLYRTTVLLRSALFWEITRHIVVIPYRRFETSYRSHFQGSEIQGISSTSRQKPEITYRVVLNACIGNWGPNCLLSECITEEHKKYAILDIFARTLWKNFGFREPQVGETIGLNFRHPCSGNGQVRVRTSVHKYIPSM